MNLAGIILSAGASTRMGSPKALLEFEGQTILDRLIAIFRLHCQELTVVLGAGAQTILDGLKRREEARFAINEHWEDGQLSSLQCGLRTVPHASAILYMPVDYPAIQASTVAALTAAVESDTAGHLVFAPQFEGRHGHPICFRSELAQELLALPTGATARDVFRKHRGRTLFLDVPDPGILHDVDSPQDYEAIRSGRLA